MRTFTVAAPLVNAEVGTSLTEDELEGVNIPALIASGHLVQVDGDPVEAPEQVQTTDPAVDTIATDPASQHEGTD